LIEDEVSLIADDAELCDEVSFTKSRVLITVLDQ
jgi:hypothetical protein